MSLSPEDFLALEPLIIERLKASCPTARAVLSADDLADVTERSQTAPALHVVYGGYRVVQTTGEGCTALTEQRWVVVVVSRCSTQRDSSPAEARARAGALVGEAFSALMGWRPAPDVQVLVPVTPPAPMFRNGMVYLPLAFTAQVTVRVQGPT